MRTTKTVWPLGWLWISLFSCTPASSQAPSTDIRLNQIGFYPDAEKVVAVVGAGSGPFSVMNPTMTETFFAGDLGPARTWTPAQESIRLADFSAFTQQGEYVVVVPDVGYSHAFVIRDNVHQDVATASIKAFYFQRASTQLDPAYAGVWARPAGHPDDEVEIHPSAATAERPAGTLIAATRGWYDAGDYNKYIVNSGISTGTLLMLYEHFPEYFGELETNIPKSGDGVPDLLDEILWNLRWMMAMQDPIDGGVYTKLTAANFEGAVMPHRATAKRYVIMKSTAATLDFAAVAALAARQLAQFGDAFPGLADSLVEAAHKGWNWARVNPEVAYDQGAMNQQFDPDVNTGGYGDGNLLDEFRWAAAELFVTTKQDSFLSAYPPSGALPLSAPGWPHVDPMGYATLAFHADDIATFIDTAAVNQELIRLADEYVRAGRESPIGTVYGISAGDFFWGGNSHAANQGFILIQAYRLTGDQAYLDTALANLDYLLGRNGTGYSFVTGHGDKTPMHPHHRQSESDGVRKPVPGMIAGGANSGRQDGCTYPSTLPAKSYVDDWCSYASNEIAINWNAALAYLAGAMEAIKSPTGRPVSNQPEQPDAEDLGSNLDLRLGPNPSSDRIQVEFTLYEPRQIDVRVYDMLGRVIAHPVDGDRLNAGSYRRPVNVAYLSSGLYAVVLNTGSRGVTRLATVIR